MGRKTFKAEEIIAHLREVEVRQSRGEDAVRLNPPLWGLVPVWVDEQSIPLFQNFA